MESAPVKVLGRSGLPSGGLNVTVMTQELPFATLEPQLFVCEKVPEPVIAMPPIPSIVLPTFVRVTCCGGGGQVLGNDRQEKDRLVGASITAVPVPLRLAVWGLPGAVSFTDNSAVRDPPTVGLKVMLIVQLAPGATDAAHV